MPIMEGWEVSSDRIKKYQELMDRYPIGDPLMTSKCKLDYNIGLLVVGDAGFAWKVSGGLTTNVYDAGKTKWIRWHDVANIIPIKNGQVIIEIKIRKNGELKLDKKGNPKITRWKFTINQNKNEEKSLWKKREESFNDLLIKIYNQYKPATDPATSDSLM